MKMGRILFRTFSFCCKADFRSVNLISAISKTGNGEWRNGKWGTGNGESLKGEISKIGNL